MDLSKKDYIKILEYYKVDHKTYGNNELKKKAEQLLANKLCRCIKKVKKNKKKRKTKRESIAICRSSVLRKKNLRIFASTCKKKATLKNLSKIKSIKTRRKKKIAS